MSPQHLFDAQEKAVLAAAGGHTGPGDALGSPREIAQNALSGVVADHSAIGSNSNTQNQATLLENQVPDVEWVKKRFAWHLCPHTR